MPVSASRVSAISPRENPVPDLADPVGEQPSSGLAAIRPSTCCCAVSASRPASCSSGVPRHWPVAGSIEKSSRAQATAGSVTRKVTLACTVMSWKSAVRAWNSIGSSRSSTGISDSTADSGRKKNARPVPSWTSLPRRKCRTCDVGVVRKCLISG